MSSPLHDVTLRIGHSPDPDDAFMWYPLANFPNGSGPGGQTFTPRIDTRPYEFIHVLEDIQSLNERAERAELEITAVSIHQYPYIAKDYALTSCGSSMGEGYGPMLVSMTGGAFLPWLEASKHTPVRIAIPGRRTTAFLALQLFLREQGLAAGDPRIEFEVVMFDQIIPAVTAGKFDAGLIIHEGQLTFGEAKLQCVVDLGKWWTATRQLPLPLGGNAIRRDLGEHMQPICRVLLRSIEYALQHRDEARQYALHYGRDLSSTLADRFIGMYVNHWTLDYGERGRAAVRQLLREGAKAGIVPAVAEVDFISP